MHLCVIPCLLPPLMCRTKNGKIGEELRLAQHWWLQVFKCNLVQHHEWFREKQPACHLYCDARGEPPRVAAVLFDGNSIINRVT